MLIDKTKYKFGKLHDELREHFAKLGSDHKHTSESHPVPMSAVKTEPN